MRKCIIFITIIGIIFSGKQLICQDAVLENLRSENPTITEKEINASIINLQNPNLNEENKALSAQLLFMAAAKGKRFNNEEISKIIEISENADYAVLHEWLVKVLWKIAAHRSTNNLASNELNAIRMSLVKNIKENSSGLLWSIYALIELGGNKQVEDDLLKIITESPKKKMLDIQISAARCLGIMKSQKAVKPLCNLLYEFYADPNPVLKERELFIESSIEIGELYKSSYINALIAIKENVAVEVRPWIKNDKPDVRYLSAVLLGRLGENSTVPLLVESLQNNRDIYERIRAAEILGELGDKKAIAPLLQAKRNIDKQNCYNKDIMIRIMEQNNYNSAIEQSLNKIYKQNKITG
jgi:HEAT repeat protein